MRDPRLTRRTLKNVIDTLSDHHQEITLAAAALNASLLRAEEYDGHPVCTSAAARRANKLASLLLAQAARCKRTEAEVKQLQIE
jgi:hypothetical protein